MSKRTKAEKIAARYRISIIDYGKGIAPYQFKGEIERRSYGVWSYHSDVTHGNDYDQLHEILCSHRRRRVAYEVAELSPTVTYSCE